MAYLLEAPVISDHRGSLCIIDKLLPFDIKRVFYIYNARSLRGGHRHKVTTQALVCLKGSCEIYLNDGEQEDYHTLDTPNKVLIVAAKDWHTMDKFTEGAILLVMASEHYDKNDYIDDKY